MAAGFSMKKGGGVRRVVLLLLFLSAIRFPVSGFSTIIPPSRRIDWTPGTNVGVVGGIPTTRTTIWKNIVTDLGADPTGVTDSSGIIANAINTCPPNQVVYIPAGNFRMNSQVYIPHRKNFTIRGAGLGQTILKPYGDTPFNFGVSDNQKPPANITITGGATKGSTTVTVTNIPTAEYWDLVDTKLIRIEHGDYTWVKPLNGGVNNMSSMFKVVSHTGTSVTFYPPLPFDYVNTPKMAVYAKEYWWLGGSASGIGVEDLTIDGATTNCLAAFFLQGVHSSWFKAVELKNMSGRQMFIQDSMLLEFRRCVIRDGRARGPNSEGLDFYQSVCWSLVEDNIFSNSSNMIVMGDSQGGCAGNVVSFNYFNDLQQGVEQAGGCIVDNHGPHNMMNLFEGNVGQALNSDGYKGGSSHHTLFRNWFSGKFGQHFPTGYAIQNAVALKHYSIYYNLVGNVLGFTGSTRAYDIEIEGYDGYGGSPPGEINAVIYQLGYPNTGNTNYNNFTTGVNCAAELTVPLITVTDPPNYVAQPGFINDCPQRFDPNVKATLARHGNYIYAAGHNAIEWETTNVNVQDFNDRNIPLSLIYGSRPSWFVDKDGAAMTWPPVDPANPKGTISNANFASILPAASRYHNLGVPPPGTWSVAVNLNGVSGYSSIAAADQTVIAAASDFGGSAVSVRASSNEGATFNSFATQGSGILYLERPVALSGQTAGVASVTITFPAVVTSIGTRDLGDVFIRRSTNGGSTFGSLIAATTGKKIFRLSMAINGSNWHLVYMTWLTGTQTWDVEHVRSTNNGLTWGTPVVISNGIYEIGVERPTIAVVGNNVYVATMDSRDNLAACTIEGGFPLNHCTEIYFVKSTDNGGTWASPLRLTNDLPYSGRPDMAAVGSTVAIVYDQRVAGGSNDIGMLVSLNSGGTWSQSLLVSALNDQTHAVIVGTASRGFHVAWMDRRNGDVARTWYKWSQDLITWSADEQVSLQNDVTITPTAGLTDNYVHLSWGESNMKYVNRFLGSSSVPTAKFIFRKH